jgi:hypothetical protein
MKTHNLKPEDSKRIKCEGENCINQAVICEHGDSIGFYYFCEKCHAKNVEREQERQGLNLN